MLKLITCSFSKFKHATAMHSFSNENDDNTLPPGPSNIKLSNSSSKLKVSGHTSIIYGIFDGTLLTSVLVHIIV